MSKLKIYIIVGLLIAGLFGTTKYLSYRVDTLKEQVAQIEGVAKSQQLQIDLIATQLQGIQALTEKNKAAIDARNAKDKTLTANKKREAELVDPKAVKEIVNDPFNEFARELQEATR